MTAIHLYLLYRALNYLNMFKKIFFKPLFTKSFRSFCTELPKFRKDFKTDLASICNRAARGIWQGKRQGRVNRISYSEHKTPRIQKVNTKIEKLYSEILDKFFWLSISKTAQKTILKYGGLDNYLLMSNPKLTADSKFATYLRALIRRKKQNPDLAIRYIPFTSKPKFRYKKKQAHEIIGIPSIYIPPEVKKTDLSDIFYPQEYFETRAEKEERLSIERELEHETDPVKRDDLRKQLNLEKYHIKVRKELLALMPIRHKMIRDTLMRGRDRPKLVLDFLKELEPSESYVKSILPPHEYKHFSDDYPEVQILLQNAEQEKAKKSKLTAKMYKEYGYGFGEVYEDITKSTEADAFDPFPGKEGKSSQLPTPRINVKFLENEKERTERKETKLNKKKVEKKNKENLIKSRRPKRENVSTIEGNTITIQ